MLKWIETTGRTEQDAISAALLTLGLDRDDVMVEVVERAKSGFLGFGGNPAKVRVSYETQDEPSTPAHESTKETVPTNTQENPPTPSMSGAEEETILFAKPKAQQPAKKQSRPAVQKNKVQSGSLQQGDELLVGGSRTPKKENFANMQSADPADETGAAIDAFLTGLLQHMQVAATPALYTDGKGHYQVILQGEQLGAIIGRRGETLDAIQQLTSYAINRARTKRVRIHVDAQGYRAKREESLQRLAIKVAGKVVKYRKNVTLETMNAYERHVIHTALQDYPNVSTYSTGVEPNRRTVVAYAPTRK